MKFTHHALRRCSQRGIPPRIISLLAESGETTSAPGGALRLTIPRREKSRLIHELKSAIDLVERASNAEIVLSSDGVVITAYHRR